MSSLQESVWKIKKQKIKVAIKVAKLRSNSFIRINFLANLEVEYKASAKTNLEEKEYFVID